MKTEATCCMVQHVAWCFLSMPDIVATACMLWRQYGNPLLSNM
jgi:hypothetical protein